MSDIIEILIEVIKYLIVVVLFVVIWIIGIYQYIQHSDFPATRIVFLIPAVFVTIAIGYALISNFINYNDPPKTIEESGYTYQLEDYEPEEVEETIEKYGKTYVLVTE